MDLTSFAEALCASWRMRRRGDRSRVHGV